MNYINSNKLYGELEWTRVLAQPYFTKETFLNLWFSVEKDSYGENESLS